MLNEITIIIVTIESRRHLLKRALEFYKGTNINIVLIDTALVDFDYDKYNLNIKYLNIKNLDYRDGYYKKISIALSIINTKYVLIGADDDFFIPKGIDECISELEADDNLIYARGVTIQFEKNKKKISYSFYESFGAIEKKLEDIKTDELTHCFCPPYSVYHGIFRKDKLSLLFSYIEKYELDIIMGECFIQHITFFLGKTKFVNVFYGAKEFNCYSGGVVIPSPYEYLQKKEYAEKVEKFYLAFEECLSMAGCEISGQKINQLMKTQYGKFNKKYNAPIINAISSLVPFKIKKIVSFKLKKLILNKIGVKEELNVLEFKEILSDEITIKKIDTCINLN